jgi:alkanesulfonate monooxygenase SsuD/methylene tetrahydromethanopterin reductase-like flavin-dependent oxidoreductase (luciferase family)
VAVQHPPHTVEHRSQRIGIAALIPAYRHPAVAATTIASLDPLSGGRLVLGVGGGFPGLSEQEFALVGVPFRTRFSHLDGTVALWRTLWTDGATSFHGRVSPYDWLPEVPRPHRPGGPPIWLAGATPSVLARAGRHYDGWLPYPPDPADYANGLAVIRDVAATEDRTGPITPAPFATVFVDDDVARGRRALDEFCLATYRMSVERVERIQVLITGSPGEVSATLDRYVTAGAEHVLVRIAAVDPGSFADQLARVAALTVGYRVIPGGSPVR